MPNIKRLMPLVGDVNGPYIAFTSRDGVAVVETERGEVPVLANDGGTMFLKAADGTSYAALPVDGNGNITANVTPRTGTLTNLLTTVAGGVGEVSYATDWDAAVIHNGVVGGARILYCKPKICTLGDASGLSVPNAAMTVMSLAAVFDPYSLLSGGGINVPSGATHFSATLTANFAANATGRRAMTLLRNNLTNGFVPYGGISNTSAAHATASVALSLAVPAQQLPGGTNSLHLGCYQDSGGALNLAITPSASSLSVQFWRES